MRTLSFYRSLFLAFIVAATLDITSAILLNWKVPVERIMRYIASGVFGKAAFTAGKIMIWYGLLFHYLIAYAWAATWFILYPTFQKFLKNKFVTGIVFGLFTWLIMNFLIVPMSNTPKPKGGMTLYGVATGLGALIICIGIPVALIADRYYYSSLKLRKTASW